MNNDMLRHFSDDPIIANMICDHIKERWPQFNNRTKINHVQHDPIHYAYPVEPVYRMPEKWGLSSWRQRLWFAAFGYALLHDLDDPSRRAAYSRGLAKAVYQTATNWLYRLIGRKRHWAKWSHKGMELVPQEIPATVPARHDTIELETFGWRIGPDEGRITCGYYPRMDILYIRSRHEATWVKGRLQFKGVR